MTSCLLLFSFTAGNLYSQQEEEEFQSIRDRFFLGGNFGLQFGTVTLLEVSPQLGYYITPRLAAGAGIRYEFYKDSREYFPFVPYQTHIYGGSIFGRYTLIKNLRETIGLNLDSQIFAQTEYEILSLERKYFEAIPSGLEGRFPLHSVLVGGGLFQPIGRKSGIVLMALWNLNQTANSPYSNPIVRIGFNF